MARPNLLILGAMKAGTTSLHNYLGLHPDIYMSEPKELNFFSDDDLFLNGEAWYQSFFKDGYEFRGESSINYSKRHIFPEVAHRIKSSLGDSVRFIYLVRDPIKRFQSNFTDSKTYGDIPSAYSINRFIEEGLEDNPLLKTGMYYYQMEPYLSLFERKSFYFLKAEDLKLRPQKTLNGIFEFLDLPSVEVEEVLKNQSDSKAYYSDSFLKLRNSSIIEGAKKLIPKAFVAALNNSHIIDKLAKRKIDPQLDRLSERNRTRIKGFLAEDMKKFEQLSGLKFD
jgi:hypothetical protein